jgi:peptidyl-prolyl cis-trans isomerase D
MATLQKIRSKGPLLLIVIGLAMLAFILGDAWKIIRPNQGVQYVGSINGEDITAMEFQKELEIYTDVVKFANQMSDITEEMQNALKDEVWATMVRNRIINNEAKAIGLVVSDAEVRDVIDRGTNPMLANTPFNNPEGKFDADLLKDFIASFNEMDPQTVSQEEYAYYQSVYNYWLFVEQNIKSELLYTKYSALVNASVMSNPVAARNAYNNRIMRTDVLVAYKPYTAVPDENVKVTSSDIKKLYNESKPALYNYAENRDLVYIDYEITPSESDRKAQLEEMNEIATQLEADIDDYTSFIRRSGSDIMFSEVSRSAKNLPYDVAARVDSVQVGGVFGPFYTPDDDTYNAFKLLAVTSGYDSIQFNIMQVIGDDEEAQANRADSIVKALKKGADFVELAANYQQTVTNQWIASDSYEPATITGDNALYLNKLNSMKKGEVATLKLSNVFIVLKVVDVKTPLTKYDIAIVKRPVEFSEETSNKAYNDLNAFLSLNTTVDQLKENAEDSDYRLLSYPGFQNYNHTVGGVAKSAEAIRWAFEAKEGEVSRLYEVGNKNDHLLVVGVEKIHPRGTRSIEDAATTLSLKAINDKKYDLLKAEFAGKSIDELKSVEGVVVDTIRFVNFNNDAFVSSLFANESTIGPSVFNLEKNELTAPMKGENCVFVAEKISDDSYSVEYDEKAESTRTRSMSSSRISGQILEELYYQAKVVDNRYKFF